MKAKRIVQYASALALLIASPLSAETKKNYDVQHSTYTLAKSTPIAKPEKTAEKKANKKKDRTKEFYLFGANTSLNPADYNAEIKKVSVGDVFGNTLTFGAGYSRKVANRLKLCLELSKNSQKVDAKKRVIATGEEIVFGYNYLSLTDVDLALRYGFPITKSIDLEFAVGPTLTQAYLESKNETDKISSVTSIYETKASLSLCQKLERYFIRAEISQRIGTSGKLDISGLEAKICVGARK